MCRGGLEAFQQASETSVMTSSPDQPSSDQSDAGHSETAAIGVDEKGDGELEYEEYGDGNDDCDDDDDFALDLARGRDGGASETLCGSRGALSLVTLKETAATVTIGGGGRRHSDVSSFYMSGEHDDGCVTGDDSFVTSEGDLSLSPMRPPREDGGISMDMNIDRSSPDDSNRLERCEADLAETATENSCGDLASSEQSALQDEVITPAVSSLCRGSYSPLPSNREVDAEGDFLRGWLACTAQLARSTPVSFKAALERVVDWAVVAAQAKLLEDRGLQDDGRGGLEAVSGEHELDRSTHNWGVVRSGSGDWSGHCEDSTHVLSYEEEGVRRVGRGREGGEEDGVDDLLSDSPGLGAAALTMSQWGRGLTAGISAFAHMVSVESTLCYMCSR